LALPDKEKKKKKKMHIGIINNVVLAVDAGVPQGLALVLRLTTTNPTDNQTVSSSLQPQAVQLA